MISLPVKLWVHSCTHLLRGGAIFMTSFFLPLANSPVPTVSPAAEIYLSLAAVGRGEETFSLPPAELSHFFLPFPPEGEKGGGGGTQTVCRRSRRRGRRRQTLLLLLLLLLLPSFPLTQGRLPPAFSSFNAKVKLEDGKTLARLQKVFLFPYYGTVGAFIQREEELESSEGNLPSCHQQS